MAISRRKWLHGGALVGAGMVAGAAATRIPRLFGPDRLPIDGGYAPGGNPVSQTASGSVRTIWHVPTTRPWVALTFDDGPRPDWTPRVLRTLARHEAVATFFVVGYRLPKYGHVVPSRYAGHEVGNHTWEHKDLAERDETSVRRQLALCHDEIKNFTGQEPKLLRPPWGHLGGTTLTVADEFGYDVAMWTYAMPEQRYEDDQSGFVADVVGNARPGSILLAHDVGASHRLVTIGHLSSIIIGLRERGFELVTVSQLLAAAESVDT